MGVTKLIKSVGTGIDKANEWRKAKNAAYKPATFQNTLKEAAKDDKYQTDLIKKRDRYKTGKTIVKTAVAVEAGLRVAPKVVGLAKQYEIKKKESKSPSAVKTAMSAAQKAVNAKKVAANKKQVKKK